MLDALPVERDAKCPFDPPAELARIQETSPLTQMRYPNGHEGWLATSRAHVRAVLSDPRFSARNELINRPVPGPVGELPAARPGEFIFMDAPEHTRYRRLLIGQFTVRRMRALADRVEQITTEHLDEMRRQGPGVDLVQAFARPIPSLMICELLGVPYEDRETFQRDADMVVGQEPDLEKFHAALIGLRSFLGDLVLAKRADPTDDLLSDLTTSDLTDEELTNIGVSLLSAGQVTTMTMLTMGTLVLLQQPERFAAMRDDTERAVEELLRYLTIIPFLNRVAHEDVELDGQRIRAGETVTLSLQAANRDPDQFTEPDVLDLGREGRGHIAFGHGVHQCLGQQLARVEMQAAFRALATRFPTLRLAVPFEELPLRPGTLNFDVLSLPVTWD
ncbi:Cytochrome P450 [Nonomuraea solani]|uniref:Cytochrome P450 n=1 Tax=Nonomuraea solani TaxID=1144553 RepID=A0A1H6EUA4_9ACTN|nr:cytochrome P450 [Nonomuraea solani]SEH00264.1 Cytochrome P450 [Nonomuraea solani]